MLKSRIIKYSRIITPLVFFLCAINVLAEEFVYKSKPEIKNAVDEILKSPEFQRTIIQNIWSYIILTIIKFLDKVFLWIGNLHNTNLFLFWCFFIGCLVILILLIWHIFYTVRKAFFLPVDMGEKDSALNILNNSYESYRGKALTEANSGNYTEAIRYLFLSLIFFFDKKQLITFNPAFTNREYLKLVPVELMGYSELTEMVALVDEKWYGKSSANATEYRKCLEFYQEVVKTNQQ